jgi:hypothetical protein
VVLSPGTLPAFQEKIKNRLDQSLDYFYPIGDREQAARRQDRLSVAISDMPAVYGKYSNVDQLKQALLSRR